jgi:hypothetical protein
MIHQGNKGKGGTGDSPVAVGDPPTVPLRLPFIYADLLCKRI